MDWLEDLRQFCIDNPLEDHEILDGPEPANVMDWTIQRPDGVIEDIHNLSAYCRKHKLNLAHLHETLTGRRTHHKKYCIIPQCPLLVKAREEIRHHRLNAGPRRARRGTANGRAKLNPEKVREIRKIHSERTMTNGQLAEAYNVKLVTIEKIVARKIWKDA